MTHEKTLIGSHSPLWGKIEFLIAASNNRGFFYRATDKNSMSRIIFGGKVLLEEKPFERSNFAISPDGTKVVVATQFCDRWWATRFLTIIIQMDCLSKHGSMILMPCSGSKFTQ